jgi:hypothetical protein
LKRQQTTSRGCIATARPVRAKATPRIHFELKNAIDRVAAGFCRATPVLTALSLFALLSAAQLLRAQSTFGSIRGTVQDTASAAVPDTKVILHSVDENTDRIVNSDSSGSYVFENLQAGHYTIRGQHTGFADSVLNGITLGARQDLRFTLTMQVAAELRLCR